MRWIVFDYGEVIGRRPARLAELAGRLGTSPEVFEAAYWELRDAYDRGLPDAEYWRGVAARAEVELTAEQVRSLVDADIAGWLDTDPQAVALLEELRAAGHGLALLSNAASTHGEAFRRQPWAGHFQHILISGDLGSAKPDPEIWQALVERLDTTPENCLFLDDKQENVDAATAAGVHAHRWTTAEAARERIAAFVGI